MVWVDVGSQIHGGAGTQSPTATCGWHGRALLLPQGEAGGGGERNLE